MRRRSFCLSALALGLTACSEDRVSGAEAVGDLDGLPPQLRRAFEANGDFEPLGEPAPGQWRAMVEDEGQSFADFVASQPNAITQDRARIYILPVGTIAGAAELEDYAERYFGGLDVAVLPAITPQSIGATTRTRGGKTQVLVDDITSHLLATIPADAYCSIAVTEQDLYPQDDWNFVFGQASLVDRVGVFSLARYDDAYFGEPPTPPQLVKRRALQVMTHEIAHMFGLSHCTYYRCNMNGSNSIEESDTQPPHLCPVCLRKLHYIVGFDPAARYERLGEYYDRAGFSELAAFTRHRRAWILGATQRR